MLADLWFRSQYAFLPPEMGVPPGGRFATLECGIIPDPARD
jgi:hypothetical protein